jgi:hypothetical protein
MESFQFHSQQSLNTKQFRTCFPYMSSNKNGMVWLGLACLLPTLVLLAELILTTEAAHSLLANFLGQSEHLIV